MSITVANEGLTIAALDFKEFSARDKDGYYDTIKSVYLKALLAYLGKEFQVVQIQQSGLFLILWCQESLPKPSNRPFTIADCIAVWLLDGDDMPPEVIPKGFGGGEPLFIDEDLVDDLQFYKIPKVNTLRSLTKYFPTAEFISYLNTGIVIELPQIPFPDFLKSLETLPTEFANAYASLQFHNGPMARTELRRLKKPDPKVIQGVFDDTDYVKEMGYFYPGTMISADAGGSISAGILVEKESEVRLTVAFHCWDEENKDKSKQLGDSRYFKLTQGDINSGTKVGYVSERIGETDIGLAKLDMPFNNRFLDIDATPKTLLHTDDIKLFDAFAIDSFVTGFQQLRCLGVRFRTEKTGEKELKGDPKNFPTPGQYISFVQGIYATSAPVISTKPQIREGVCGSVLFRISKAKSSSKKSPSIEQDVEVMAEGGIGGFMHWSDLQSKSQEVNLLCYADAANELFEAGWEVCQIADKAEG
jgi:hypothetical protein